MLLRIHRLLHRFEISHFLPHLLLWLFCPLLFFICLDWWWLINTRLLRRTKGRLWSLWVWTPRVQSQGRGLIFNVWSRWVAGQDFRWLDFYVAWSILVLRVLQACSSLLTFAVRIKLFWRCELFRLGWWRWCLCLVTRWRFMSNNLFALYNRLSLSKWNNLRLGAKSLLFWIL